MPKRLGQHFLKNTAITGKIVAELDIQKGDVILEIGPGKGALTLPLLQICFKNEAKIIAIERDKALIKELEAKIHGLGAENLIKIVHDDALNFLKNIKESAPELPSRFKLVGNIPYYITGHLFRIISEMAVKPSRTIVMIQEEVAERICATPPRMNRLAASAQYWAEPKIIGRAGKNDFSPSPDVDSAVIKLETIRATQGDADNYYAVMRALFAQPRKTVLNNLESMSSDTKKKQTKESLASQLQKLGIDPGSRPQNLTIENIRVIAEACG